MKILLFILLSISVSNAPALVADNLIDAVIHVESRGDINAHNVGEDAVGVLQIRPIMVQEVNRVLGFDKYTLIDRWDKQKSIEMFNVIRQNTPNPTNEKVARNWNGGPNGYKKQSTLKYWNKVKNQL
jgi:soluble lytic murein transglycosylase-like protein